MLKLAAINAVEVFLLLVHIFALEDAPLKTSIFFFFFFWSTILIKKKDRFICLDYMMFLNHFIT